MTDPILFARIGWMTYYRGPQAGDQRPKGGGKYNRTELGHEVFNFKPIGGKLFGYFQPQMQADSIQLERIDPGCGGESLDSATVIFVATHPQGGQRVIGWYRNARVFRRAQTDKTGHRMGFAYYVDAQQKDAVLLPTRKRTQFVPVGNGGFGQANVRYVNNHGKRLPLPWADDAVAYIQSYTGGNLLTHPELESLTVIEEEIESQLNKAAGFESNPAIRCAVEARAMDVVAQHYQKLGLAVQDVHETRSYDFECRSSERVLYVEVKGTRSTGETISLTANEVELAKRCSPNTVLCVVHSIQVSGHGKPRAIGGEVVIYDNWNPEQHDLRPVAFVCTLSHQA